MDDEIKTAKKHNGMITLWCRYKQASKGNKILSLAKISYGYNHKITKPKLSKYRKWENHLGLITTMDKDIVTFMIPSHGPGQWFKMDRKVFDKMIIKEE